MYSFSVACSPSLQLLLVDIPWFWHLQYPRVSIATWAFYPHCSQCYQMACFRDSDRTTLYVTVFETTEEGSNDPQKLSFSKAEKLAPKHYPYLVLLLTGEVASLNCINLCVLTLGKLSWIVSLGGYGSDLGETFPNSFPWGIWIPFIFLLSPFMCMIFITWSLGIPYLFS